MVDDGALDGGAVAGDGVRMRFLLVRELPLVVASVGDEGRGAQLHAALVERGLTTIPSFLGRPLPQGAKVGFVLDRTELRLVDERDDTLLRAPRAGLDDGWLTATRRLKGTMTVVVRGLDLQPDTPPRDLAQAVDEAAAAGAVLGAVVGVVEERPTLPLLLGP